ncbi:MAG: hypothetical protein ACI8XU_002150 [Kiritimatiellia bacterium]|jgi:hypothetical protein
MVVTVFAVFRIRNNGNSMKKGAEQLTIKIKKKSDLAFLHSHRLFPRRKG